MKYFAKWLPVEGEIKKGNNNQPVWDKSSSRVRYFSLETEEKLKQFKELDGYKTGSYLPVKLFLCSGDIKNGDRTNYRGFKGYACSPTQPNGIWDFFDQNNGLHHIYKENLTELFKVIGEISPEATWVKEGDVFDENDIHIPEHPHIVAERMMKEATTGNYITDALKHMKGEILNKTIIPKSLEKIYTTPIVSIKCPHCGTFT